MLRLRDVSGVKRELAELGPAPRTLARDVETLARLVEALPPPVWARDDAGRLIFVNPAYARAVEAKTSATPSSAVSSCSTRGARRAGARARRRRNVYARRLPAIVAGRAAHLRRPRCADRAGSAGIGIDATEVETHARRARRA